MFAVVHMLEERNEHDGGLQLTAGKHLHPVQNADQIVIKSVEEIVETLLYIQCSDDQAFITRVANKHGDWSFSV